MCRSSLYAALRILQLADQQIPEIDTLCAAKFVKWMPIFANTLNEQREMPRIAKTQTQ